MKRSTKTLLRAGALPVAIIASFLALWQFLSPSRPPTAQIPFSDFMKLVRADREAEPHVVSATVAGEDITFWVKEPKTTAKFKRGTRAPARLPDYAKELLDHDIHADFVEEETPIWSSAAVTLFPLVSLWAIFYWVARRSMRKIEAIAMGMTTRDLELERQLDQERERADAAERRLAELRG
jgi:cell division protease FtsH